MQVTRQIVPLSYEPKHRFLEATALVLFGALGLWCAWRMAGTPAWLIVPAALGAWIATDFFSGLVHWAGDTWGSARTPCVGPWFIRPFREHHDDPLAMTKHDFVETNGSSAIAGLPLLLAGAALPIEGPGSAFSQAFLLFLALGGLVANQCHKWAHMKEANLPALVALGQRMRLILPPKTHRRHHARPHDTHYCTASGWMNEVLERSAFFRRIERGISSLTQKNA